MRRRAAIYGWRARSRTADRRLPLCLAARPCLHGPFLYVPKGWTDDAARMKAAHVRRKRPLHQACLAVGMMSGHRTAVPFAFVAPIASTALPQSKGRFGGLEGLCSWRRFQSQRQLLGQDQADRGHGGTRRARLGASDWKRLSAGDGARDLASMTGLMWNWPISTPANTMPAAGLWTRGLLIRRTIADHDLAFFSTWAPAGTQSTNWSASKAAAGHEDSFETAKNELGLDHNETRSWHGWHRHVSLVMLAFAMMATIRHRAKRCQHSKRYPDLWPAAYPLVPSGNSPHSHKARATTHRAGDIIAGPWRRAIKRRKGIR